MRPFYEWPPTGRSESTSTLGTGSGSAGLSNRRVARNGRLCQAPVTPLEAPQPLKMAGATPRNHVVFLGGRARRTSLRMFETIASRQVCLGDLGARKRPV